MDSLGTRSPLRELDSTNFDVLIIGGGINGCTAAQHLAAEGFSVLLVEKNDFASAASSRSSRLLHCGLRYLAPERTPLEFLSRPGRLRTAVSMAVRSLRARRQLPNPADWHVTPTTQRLVSYWRDHEFEAIRPFFCQLEAVETIIWLAEVAGGPERRRYREVLSYIQRGNEEANPLLQRLALKMATGSGKTTVMAMLIAWQTINATRNQHDDRFGRSFLVVAPGITIRDRLRVLLRKKRPFSFTHLRSARANWRH